MKYTKRVREHEIGVQFADALSESKQSTSSSWHGLIAGGVFSVFYLGMIVLKAVVSQLNRTVIPFFWGELFSETGVFLHNEFARESPQSACADSFGSE